MGSNWSMPSKKKPGESGIITCGIPSSDCSPMSDWSTLDHSIDLCSLFVSWWNGILKFESVKEVYKRFLRCFRFSNVVLLKRTTFENLWKTSKRFLKGSRSPEVFQRFSVDIFRIFSMYFITWVFLRIRGVLKKKTPRIPKNLTLYVKKWGPWCF